MKFHLFQCVPIISGPVTGQLWEESGSVFFSPSIHLFRHIGNALHSLLLSGLNSPSSLSLYLYERCSSALIFFLALHWTCFRKSMSLLHWGAQTWAQYPSYGLTGAKRKRGKISSLAWLATVFLMQCRLPMAWGCIAGSCSDCCPLGSPGPSLQWCCPAACPLVCMRLFLSMGRTLPFPLLTCITVLLAQFNSLTRSRWMMAQPPDVSGTPGSLQ